MILAPEFPTGRSEALVDTDFEGVRTNLPTGDGEFNLWTRLAISRSLPTPNPVSTYVSAYGGYNLRTGFTNQIDTGAEVGVGLFQRVWLQGRFSALFAPGSVEDFDPEGIFLFGEGTEYVAAGAAASVKVFDTPIWVNLEFNTTFANLRNLYAGTTFVAGVSADW